MLVSIVVGGGDEESGFGFGVSPEQDVERSTPIVKIPIAIRDRRLIVILSPFLCSGSNSTMDTLSGCYVFVKPPQTSGCALLDASLMFYGKRATIIRDWRRI